MGEGTPAWRRADGGPVGFDARPLGRDEVRTGDLVFIGAEHTGLGALVSELDGCGFSHVGVLDLQQPGPPAMWSARTDSAGSFGAPDLGGVRRNELPALAGRGVFVAPLAEAVDDDRRAWGLARIAAWHEVRWVPGDTGSRSRFSFARLVAVSAALASVRRRDPMSELGARHVWTAAERAVRALAEGDGVPGFYCAEMIAEAYRLEFTRDAFWVPDGEPHPAGAPEPDPPEPPPPGALIRTLLDGPEEHVPTAAEVRAAVRELQQALQEVGADGADVLAVAHLVFAVSLHDARLAVDLVRAALELRPRPGEAPRPRRPRPVPPGPFTPPPFVRRAVPVPPGLVTPRMLLSPAVVRAVHPLRL